METIFVILASRGMCEAFHVLEKYAKRIRMFEVYVVTVELFRVDILRSGKLSAPRAPETKKEFGRGSGCDDMLALDRL
jgi:hypothetical protein